MSISIEDFAKRVGANLNQSARAIKIALFDGVIQDTRVDTGRLRGNWQTQTGRPATTQTERRDPTGQQSSAEAVANVTAQGVDYMSNNLEYAQHWEERDGMVAKNLARVQTIIRKQKG